MRCLELANTYERLCSVEAADAAAMDDPLAGHRPALYDKCPEYVDPPDAPKSFGFGAGKSPASRLTIPSEPPRCDVGAERQNVVNLEQTAAASSTDSFFKPSVMWEPPPTSRLDSIQRVAEAGMFPFGRPDMHPQDDHPMATEPIG